MLRRKAEREMEAWKREDSQRALIVTGARQVGKTTMLRHCMPPEGLYLVSVKYGKNE